MKRKKGERQVRSASHHIGTLKSRKIHLCNQLFQRALQVNPTYSQSNFFTTNRPEAKPKIREPFDQSGGVRSPSPPRTGDLSCLGSNERIRKAEAREGRVSGSERVIGPGRGGARGTGNKAASFYKAHLEQTSRRQTPAKER